jgi:hypothetical protein
MCRYKVGGVDRDCPLAFLLELLSFEGVWGSYKTRAIFARISVGIHGLPQVNLGSSMSSKLTRFNVCATASKLSTIKG